MRRHKTIGYVVVDTKFHKLARIALEKSMQRFPVDDVMVFSDNVSAWPESARYIQIDPIETIDQYNKVMCELVPLHAICDYYITIQYDGFVLDSERWEANFLEFDYIGAPWPNFPFYNVGNGGFSLRSRRLLEAVRQLYHYRPTGEAEDVFICRTIRMLLEKKFHLRFADEATALRFSFESPGHPKYAFGFHGVLNLAIAYGADFDGFFNAAVGTPVLMRRGELLFGTSFLRATDARNWAEQISAKCRGG